MITPIPTPYHLLDTTCTVKLPLTGQDTSGQWQSALGEVDVDGTFLCNIQPTSSVEGLEYQQATGRKTYDVFITGTDTSGTNPAASVLRKFSVLTYNSLRLELTGEVRNLCENGCIWACIASEFTD